MSWLAGGRVLLNTKYGNVEIMPQNNNVIDVDVNELWRYLGVLYCCCYITIHNLPYLLLVVVLAVNLNLNLFVYINHR